MEVNNENETKKWTDNVLIKVIIIGFLILVLMIPSMMINELVRERSSRKMEVTNEVSSKWGQLQTVIGPYIVIPYMEEVKYANQLSEWKEQRLFYFPQTLEINGKINPAVKKRSIFKVMLYESDLNIQGSFSYPDLNALKIDADKVLWDKASLYLSITDLSGIGARVNLQLGDTLIPMTAAVPVGLQLPSGLMCNLPDDVAKNEKLDFTILLSLKGSQGFIFHRLEVPTRSSSPHHGPHQNLKVSFYQIRVPLPQKDLTLSGTYSISTGRLPNNGRKIIHRYFKMSIQTDTQILTCMIIPPIINLSLA